jgi:hypothetical protein
MALVNYPETLRSAATRSLGTLTAGGFLGGLAALYAALLAGSRPAASHLVPKMLRGVLGALYEYHRQAAVAPVVLALSVFNQTLTCAMYYLALQATGVTGPSVRQFFLIVPLGMIAESPPVHWKPVPPSSYPAAWLRSWRGPPGTWGGRRRREFGLNLGRCT